MTRAPPRPNAHRSAPVEIRAGKVDLPATCREDWLCVPGRDEPLAPTTLEFTIWQLCGLSARHHLLYAAASRAVGRYQSSNGLLSTQTAPMLLKTLENRLRSLRASLVTGLGLLPYLGSRACRRRDWTSRATANVDTIVEGAGVLDWATMTHLRSWTSQDNHDALICQRPRCIPVSGDDTLLSRRDAWRTNADLYFRGVYVWKLGIGSKTLGIASSSPGGVHDRISGVSRILRRVMGNDPAFQFAAQRFAHERHRRSRVCQFLATPVHRLDTSARSGSSPVATRPLELSAQARFPLQIKTAKIHRRPPC